MFQARIIASSLSILITAYLFIFYNVSIAYQEVEYYSTPMHALILRLLCIAQLIMSIRYAKLWYKSLVKKKDPEESSEEGGSNINRYLQIGMFLVVSILGTCYQPYLFTIHILDLFSMKGEL